jgi:hypothetical protein
MPIPSPVLEAINLELRELEAVAARLRDLTDEDSKSSTRRSRLYGRRCGR